jgi:Ca2+-binding EF-hand superfamily protein
MAARPNSAEHAFTHLDHDGDGYVTAQDFERMARAIIDAFGIDEASPKAVRLLAGYRRTFEMVLAEMDTAPDGRIGAEEFMSAMAALSGRAARSGKGGSGLGRVCAAEFAAADRDDDGVITRTEFAHLLSSIGQSSGDADAAFDALDRDRDGRITRAEYVAAWEDYLVSDNPDSAGARVFAGL